jgi:hypothetical protein
VPRYRVDRFFWTPQTVLPLTVGGGGGSRIGNKKAHIQTAQMCALRSTAQIGFRTPPTVLPLMVGGGGGPKCWLTITHRSTVEKKALRSMTHGVFRTPPIDLSLMEGGGVRNGIFLWWALFLYVA